MERWFRWIRRGFLKVVLCNALVMKRLVISFCVAVMVFAIVSESTATAQRGKRWYIDGGRQINITQPNPFLSGLDNFGAYMDGGYYVIPGLAVGGFFSFTLKDAYFPKKGVVDGALVVSGLTLDSESIRSIYQLPFGATVRWRMRRAEFQPYLEAKIGAEYHTESVYTPKSATRSVFWGLHLCSSSGFMFFPFEDIDFGFHLASYYSYVLFPSGKALKNLGFCIGMVF